MITSQKDVEFVLGLAREGLRHAQQESTKIPYGIARGLLDDRLRDVARRFEEVEKLAGLTPNDIRKAAGLKPLDQPE